MEYIGSVFERWMCNGLKRIPVQMKGVKCNGL